MCLGRADDDVDGIVGPHSEWNIDQRTGAYANRCRLRPQKRPLDIQQVTTRCVSLERGAKLREVALQVYAGRATKLNAGGGVQQPAHLIVLRAQRGQLSLAALHIRIEAAGLGRLHQPDPAQDESGNDENGPEPSAHG